MYVWHCMINNVILGLSKTNIAAKRTPIFWENDHGSWDSRIACSCRRILWVSSGSPFRSGHIVLGEGSLGKKHEGIAVCFADFLYCLIMFNRSWIELHAYQRCTNQVCSISCEVQSRVLLFGFIHGKQQLWSRRKTGPFHKADHCKILSGQRLSGNLRRLRKITMLKRLFHL